VLATAALSAIALLVVLSGLRWLLAGLLLTRLILTRLLVVRLAAMLAALVLILLIH
jgi:hypothetical protein